MTFTGDLDLKKKFSVTLHTRERAIFVGVVEEAHQSVVFGSVITGSAGQPADLRNDFPIEMGEDFAEMSSSDNSAPAVETGISRFDGHPIKLKSPIGGMHSIDITVQHFDKIVDEVARQVVGER